MHALIIIKIINGIVLQTVKIFPEPYGSQGLFAETGDSWREHRHVLTPAFSASKMKLVHRYKLLMITLYHHNSYANFE